MLPVVGRVDDDGELRWIGKHPGEAVHQFDSADPAAEDRNHIEKGGLQERDDRVERFSRRHGRHMGGVAERQEGLRDECARQA